MALIASVSRLTLQFGIFLLALTLFAQEQPPPAEPNPELPKEDPIEEPLPENSAMTGSTTSAAAALPGANSTVPGANDILNFQTDLFTGRFSYSVPIVVSPGRQGVEPKLALTHNSAA